MSVSFYLTMFLNCLSFEIRMVRRSWIIYCEEFRRSFGMIVGSRLRIHPGTEKKLVQLHKMAWGNVILRSPRWCYG
jgi:hypothetical protein